MSIEVKWIKIAYSLREKKTIETKAKQNERRYEENGLNLFCSPYRCCGLWGVSSRWKLVFIINIRFKILTCNCVSINMWRTCVPFRLRPFCLSHGPQNEMTADRRFCFRMSASYETEKECVLVVIIISMRELNKLFICGADEAWRERESYDEAGKMPCCL